MICKHTKVTPVSRCVNDIDILANDCTFGSYNLQSYLLCHEIYPFKILGLSF